MRNSDTGEPGAQSWQKKILCAVDGSEPARVATVVASDMARALAAELTFLAVNERVNGSGASPFLWDANQTKELLDSAINQAKLAGVENAKAISVESRDVARAIVVYAEEHAVDNIVIGPSGKGGLKRLILGSVSQDVAARAHCTVTLARSWEF